MVLATTINAQGILGELNLPAKTGDVLEWLRKKLKQPSLQYQGKIANETYAFAVFASPCEEDEEETVYVMPPPFHDDSFQGTIVLLKTNNLNGDEYEKPAFAHASSRAHWWAL